MSQQSNGKSIGGKVGSLPMFKKWLNCWEKEKKSHFNNLREIQLKENHF
jgi:hypothetical protein